MVVYNLKKHFSLDKVLFRVDSSIEIGGGHLSRCLEIAKLLNQRKINVFFLCKELEGNLNEWIKYENFKLFIIRENYISIEEEIKDIEKLLKPFSPFKYLIIDNYSIDKVWENAIKKIIPKIVVIDDLANRKHNCDILIDQNYISNHENRYKALVPKETIQLLSSKYAIIKDKIKNNKRLSKPNFKKPSKLFICFGAIDSKGYTLATLRALKKISHKFELISVFTSNKNISLKDITYQGSLINNCKIYTDHNLLPDLLSSSDIAIGAGGTMSWERALLGIPSLVFGIADNQTKVLESLIKNGIVIGESSSKFPDENKIQNWLEVIISNPKLLEGLSERSRKIIDGYGCNRICEVLFPSEIKFRYAIDKDSKKIFEWRNLPEIQKISKKQDEIKFYDHQKWFENCMHNPNSILLIAEYDLSAIGVIRFDINDKEAEISIYKIPGKKKIFGLLNKSTSWFFENYPKIKTITANIIPNNVKSCEAFFSAGYKQLNFKFIKERNS